jgi:hypothetical protein
VFVAKKKSSAKKAARSKKAPKKRTVKSTADTSRLDTGPLQEHIRKRIKDLEGKATLARSDDDTIQRLRQALETLEDICFPSMTVPI